MDDLAVARRMFTAARGIDEGELTEASADAGAADRGDLVKALVAEARAVYDSSVQEERARFDAHERAHTLRNTINNLHLQFAILEQLASCGETVSSATIRERTLRGRQCLDGLKKVIADLEHDWCGEPASLVE